MGEIRFDEFMSSRNARLDVNSHRSRSWDRDRWTGGPGSGTGTGPGTGTGSGVVISEKHGRRVGAYMYYHW